MKVKGRLSSERMHLRPLRGSARRLRRPARSCPSPSRHAQASRASVMVLWRMNCSQGQSLRTGRHWTECEIVLVTSLLLPSAQALTHCRACTVRRSEHRYSRCMSRDCYRSSELAVTLRRPCTCRLSRQAVLSAEAHPTASANQAECHLSTAA